MSDFIEKQRNRQLLEQLNEAYKDAPEPEEKQWQKSTKRQQRRLMEK